MPLLQKYFKYTEINSDPNEFSKNILPLIHKYPETRFILFFPPYSIYKYAIDAQNSQSNTFLSYQKLVERIVLETESATNAEIYWFSDNKFIHDISNYKDLTHYHSHYNSIFLEQFSVKKSLINISNYKILLRKLADEARSVNLVKFALLFSQPIK
jgi:hypothetical protein